MITKTKLAFDEALERINEERSIKREDVRADALNRKIWMAANGLPGCLYDHSGICMTKKDAIEECLTVADDGEGPPKGMASWLRESGDRSFADDNGYLYHVKRLTLADVL